MAKKPLAQMEYKEVTYDAKRWILLRNLRDKAIQIMEALDTAHLESTVHGSIARGDVKMKSDIDVFISHQTSSFIVETALENADIPINRRLVVQATPTYAMKAYIEIDDNTGVSFPLMRMRKVEREFYRFGGEVTLQNLSHDLRIAGVDKRLMLIEPTDEGHRENSIIGREGQAADVLGISVETVMDRVHTLLRRDQVGRTGVFLKRELSGAETFEMALKRFAYRNPAVRRRLASL